MADTQMADQVWAQLGILRGLTRTTGVLHEAQVLQLKMWPRLAIPHAESTEFGWDPINRTIEFRARVARGQKPPRDLVKRLKGLDRSVKSLLGTDVVVRVKAGTSVLFTSAGKKEKKGVRN